MNEIEHLEIRKKIYKILLNNPGLNLSKIAELLKISPQLADYHLSYMKKSGLIDILKEEGYKRNYIKGKIGTSDKKLLSILNQDKPLNIVLFLLKNPISKPGDIKDEMNISSALLTYYLKKLKKFNLISEIPSSGKKRLGVINEEQVMRILIQYKSNVLLKRFKQTWIDEFPLSSKISDEKKKRYSK